VGGLLLILGGVLWRRISRKRCILHVMLSASSSLPSVDQRFSREQPSSGHGQQGQVSSL
jgi:hypothetical protein